jgi:hypothetical protein
MHSSEHEKEKALLLQKVQFYENQLKEQSQKEKLNNSEYRNTKKEHTSQIQEMQRRYEQQNKELQFKIDELQDYA